MVQYYKGPTAVDLVTHGCKFSYGITKCGLFLQLAKSPVQSLRNLQDQVWSQWDQFMGRLGQDGGKESFEDTILSLFS